METTFALVRVPNYYEGTYNAPVSTVIATGTREECNAATPDMSGIYYTSHGEAGRPTYEIRELVEESTEDAWSIAERHGATDEEFDDFGNTEAEQAYLEAGFASRGLELLMDDKCVLYVVSATPEVAN